MDQHLERFSSSAHQLATLMTDAGCDADPIVSTALPFFSILDPSTRDRSLGRIEDMVLICRDVLARNRSINDSPALVESFLVHANLTSTPDLFTKLEYDDCIEVYDTNHVSLFVSANTLSRISLTLEELYCRKWTEFLRRDVIGVHESLLALSLEMIAGKHRTTVSTSYIPDHVVREHETKERRSIITFPRLFAPVYRDGVVAGYLCANKLFPHNEAPIDL